MRTLATLFGVFTLAFAAMAIPQGVHAQAMCEAASTGTVALAGAPAVGALGGAIAGAFDKVDDKMDQAAAGTVVDSAGGSSSSTAQASSEAPATPPAPSGQTGNMPGPAVAGC